MEDYQFEQQTSEVSIWIKTTSSAEVAPKKQRWTIFLKTLVFQTIVKASQRYLGYVNFQRLFVAKLLDKIDSLHQLFEKMCIQIKAKTQRHNVRVKRVFT